MLRFTDLPSSDPAQRGAGRPLDDAVLQSAREAVMVDDRESSLPTQIVPRPTYSRTADISGPLVESIRRYVIDEPVRSAAIAATAGGVVMVLATLLLGRVRRNVSDRRRKRAG